LRLYVPSLPPTRWHSSRNRTSRYHLGEVRHAEAAGELERACHDRVERENRDERPKAVVRRR
jgi:hypothetical protein